MRQSEPQKPDPKEGLTLATGTDAGQGLSGARRLPQGMGRAGIFLHIAGMIGPAIGLAIQSILLFCLTTSLSVQNQIPPGLMNRAFNNFRPERDLQVYIGSLVFSVFATWAFYASANRSCKQKTGDRLIAYASAAGAFSLLASVACLGLFFAAFIYLRDLAAFRLHFVEWVLLVPMVMTALAATVLRSRGAAWFEDYVRCRAARRKLAIALEIGVLILLALILLMPDCRAAAGMDMGIDHFHHWDYFAVAPALAYRHGAALVYDVYTQYGAGWPFILASISYYTGLTYDIALWMATAVGFIYFVGVHQFIKACTRNSLWAAMGTMAALFLHVFYQMTTVAWFYPSSTILRGPVDIWVMLSLLLMVRRRRAAWGVVSGALVGLGMFMETDTGIYLFVAWGFFWLVRLSPMPAAGKWNDLRREGLIAGAGALVGVIVFASGLLVATRGTCIRLDFWKLWLEAISDSSGGLYMLPLATYPDAACIAEFILVIAVYLGVILVVVSRAFAGFPARMDAVTGTLAAYGTMMMIQFIGRSHPLNLNHVIVPAILLIIMLLFGASRWIARSMRGFKMDPVARFQCRTAHALFAGMFGIACLTGVIGVSGFVYYPNLIFSLSYGQVQGPLFADDLLGVKVTQAQIQTCELVDQLSELITKSTQEGKRVFVVAGAETQILVAADVPPWTRYSPLLPELTHRYKVNEVTDQINKHPPDIVVITRNKEGTPGNTDDSRQLILDAMAPRMTKIQSIGSFEVWELNSKGSSPAVNQGR